MTDPLQLLFVCTANVCRSPLAEAFANGYARRARLNVASTSASVQDVVRRTHPWVLDELASRRLDLGRSTSQPLTTDLVDAADLVLTMTGQHAIAVASQFRHATGKIFILDHLVQVIPSPEPGQSIDEWLAPLDAVPRKYPAHPGVRDVPDPIGGDEATFRRVADLIDELVTRLMTTIDIGN